MERKQQVRVSCSLFTRILLAKDAKSLDRSINSHLNDILKMHLNGEFSHINSETICVYFLEPIVSKNNQLQISFNLKPSLYSVIKTNLNSSILEEVAIKDIAEDAVNNYILSSLTGSIDERGKNLNKLATETLQEIELMNINNPGC